MTIEFLDGRTVEHTYFLERRITAARKHPGNPVIPDCHSCQTILPADGGGYHMWYVSVRPIANPAAQKYEYTLHYAVSDDGFQWTLPHLGLREVDGSRDNNVVLTRQDLDGDDVHDAKGIWNFCVIDREQTPAPHTRGRYTALVGDRSFAWSDDGLHWTFYPENPVLDPGGSDTFNNFHFDRRIGRYVYYHRPPKRIHAGDWRQVNRLVARIESDDLIHWDWGSARCVLDTDARDAPAVSYEKELRGRDVQFYSMTVAPYQDFYIGFANRLNEVTGVMDQRLVHSYDGFDWRRAPLETPIIETTPNAWDCGMIGFVAAGSPLLLGDELCIYYGGINWNHNKEIVDGRDTIYPGLGIASVKRGRLIGYHAGDEKGELLTRPFTLQSPHLSLNADAADGEITAAVFHGDGTPVSNLAADQAQPIHDNGLDLPLRWNDETVMTSLVGQRIRLRLTGRNAAMYAISMA